MIGEKGAGTLLDNESATELLVQFLIDSERNDSKNLLNNAVLLLVEED